MGIAAHAQSKNKMLVVSSRVEDHAKKELRGQVAQNRRPLYPEATNNSLKVAHHHGSLAAGFSGCHITASWTSGDWLEVIVVGYPTGIPLVLHCLVIVVVPGTSRRQRNPNVLTIPEPVLCVASPGMSRVPLAY